ncbi:hypothetical protein ONS95_011713 [Cadophora gregata]|uniref:uncharacterized protein n=1 Tax=Cadophora gregata TaxID=51156 RepID=UPI0026DC4F8A|nr:uncharacterized protein ONS95_011713 [Cadophora gregata]KAK0120307.1 hypothetical protein ONS95_011713 [Cadophora gregata]KAK0121340.1 hypothetical protein ONS96_011515 [Cadophora gregata f. sp. sojae]
MFRTPFSRRPPKAQRIQLANLPKEILIHVLSYLSSWDYLSLAHTSHGYRTFINCNANDICLAAMTNQPECSTYPISITVDDRRCFYCLRLGLVLLKKRFRAFQHTPRLWKPKPLPVFILYLEENSRCLEPRVASAYARHILGELIEIRWMDIGGLTHRRKKGVKTVTLHLEENSILTSRWFKVWVDGPLMLKPSED